MERGGNATGPEELAGRRAKRREQKARRATKRLAARGRTRATREGQRKEEKPRAEQKRSRLTDEVAELRNALRIDGNIDVMVGAVEVGAVMNPTIGQMQTRRWLLTIKAQVNVRTGRQRDHGDAQKHGQEECPATHGRRLARLRGASISPADLPRYGRQNKCKENREVGNFPLPMLRLIGFCQSHCRRASMNRLATLALSLAALVFATSAAAADVDWPKVDQALGKKGSMQAGGVYKFGLPRTDLKITVDGVAIDPSLALGSWVAFKPAGDGAMLMGDLVLTDHEISPVMKRLIDGGVEITAIHNHLFRTSAPVYYMHVGGHGDPVKLAATLHAALSLSKTPFTATAAKNAAPAVPLDTAALENVLGFRGKLNGRVYQFAIPRAETITERGMEVPPSMGTATSINFQPTGGGKAATTGDFVLLAAEVNPVLRALRANGIEVTALHSHMIDDAPHLYFMHFWANDSAVKLARGLRAALDHANLKHST